MPQQPVQLDPLPQLDLKADQQKFTPPPSPQPLPAEAGFVGKAGAGAYIATNLLNGVMAGRHIKQQRQLNEAQQEVGSARSIYDSFADQYRSAIDNGVDQNSEQFKKLKANTASSWNNWVSAASKYVKPEEEKGGGKGKGKGKQEEHPHAGLFKKMFGVDNPHLITEASLSLLKQSGPDAFMYTPDTAKEQQRKIGSQVIQQNENTIKEQQHKLAVQADVTELQKQLSTAIAKGDTASAQSARERLAVYGQTVPEVMSDVERSNVQEAAKIKKEALDAVAGGKDIRDLPYNLQMALGQTPPTDEFSVYMNFPKYRNHPELAVAAYDRAMRSRYLMQRQPTAYDELKQSTRVLLDHELQDPEKAKKYGLKEALKPGQEAPQWLVEDQTMQRANKLTTSDKSALKAEAKTTLGKAAKVVRSVLTPEDQEFMDKYVVQKDEDTGTSYIVDDSPDVENQRSFWHPFTGTAKVGESGLSPEDFNRKRNEILGRIRRNVYQAYPGMTDDAREAVNDELGLAPDAVVPPSPSPSKSGTDKPKPMSATPDKAEIPKGNGRKLAQGNAADEELGNRFLDMANGDPKKAAELAAKYGYTF